MTEYRIKTPAGSYWTGEAWGTEAQATVLEYQELPLRLRGASLMVTTTGLVYVNEGEAEDLSDARLVADVVEVMG